MSLFQGWQIAQRLTTLSQEVTNLTGAWPASRVYQLTLQTPELASGATSEQQIKAPDDAPWWWFGQAGAFAGGEEALDQLDRLQIAFSIRETSRVLASGVRGEAPATPSSGFLPFDTVVGRLTDPYWWAFPVPCELGDRITVELQNNAGDTIPAAFLTLFGFQVLYTTPNSPGSPRARA